MQVAGHVKVIPRAGVPQFFGFNSLANFWTHLRSTQSFIFSKKCPADLLLNLPIVAALLYVGAMIDIPAAPEDPNDENRNLLCQMAVELPIQDVIEAAVAAGWTELETLAAMIEVADNLMLANVNNAELDALLKAMKRKLD